MFPENLDLWVMQAIWNTKVKRTWLE